MRNPESSEAELVV